MLAVVVQALDLRLELLVEPPVPELQVAHRPLVLRPLRFEEGLAPLLDGFDLLAQRVEPSHLHGQLVLVLVLQLVRDGRVLPLLRFRLLPLHFHERPVLVLGLVAPPLLGLEGRVLLRPVGLEGRLPLPVLERQPRLVLAAQLVEPVPQVHELGRALLDVLERELHHLDARHERRRPAEQRGARERHEPRRLVRAAAAAGDARKELHEERERGRRRVSELE